MTISKSHISANEVIGARITHFISAGEGFLPAELPGYIGFHCSSEESRYSNDLNLMEVIILKAEPNGFSGCLDILPVIFPSPLSEQRCGFQEIFDIFGGFPKPNAKIL
jgi:hypothetical protein